MKSKDNLLKDIDFNNLNDIDEETKDELFYDEDTMSIIMDEIYNATKNNKLLDFYLFFCSIC